MNFIPARRSRRERSGLRFAGYALAFLMALLLPVRLNSVPRDAGARRPAQAQGAIPMEVARLMAQATQAVNQRRIETLRTLSMTEAATAFDWTKRSAIAWEGDALAAPASPFGDGTPTYLAVFHAWHPCQSEGDHVHRMVHTEQGWKIGEEIPEAETLGFRLRDHDMHIAVNVGQKTASILDNIQLERTSGGVPAFALIRLSQDFQVQSLLRDGGDPKSGIPFQQAGGIIAFTPPSDKIFMLAVKYEGSVNHRDGDFIHENESVMNSYWYPHIARLPATATFTVTGPPGWTPLAQGELLHSDRNREGSLTVTYRNLLPVSYFTLDMGRYTITSRQVDGITLTVYLMTPSATLANRCLDMTARALKYYAANFGPFPYTRYGIVESKGPFSGALEAYSFSTYGPQNLPEIIPHELAHTWWGGIVPCPYTRSMWNEGFANYSDELQQRASQAPWKPHDLTPKEAADALSERRRITQAYDACSLAEARDTEEAKQVGIGYEKGSQVLRALEEEIGQEAMLHSMRTFVADHKRGEAADWSDFEAAVKKTTRQDMRWFFAQWVERSGVPAAALENVRAQRQGGDYVIEGDIAQGDAPYRLKMPVLLALQNGELTLSSVEVRGERTHFQLKAAFPPARLTLDPEGLLLLAAPPSGDPTTYYFR